MGGGLSGPRLLEEPSCLGTKGMDAETGTDIGGDATAVAGT